MNSKLCKQIRKQSKTILVEWFKTLVSEEQSKGINESNMDVSLVGLKDIAK